MLIQQSPLSVGSKQPANKGRRAILELTELFYDVYGSLVICMYSPQVR